MIRKAYSFPAAGKCRSTSVVVDARCVFFDDKRDIGELEFFDELEAALKTSTTLPDCVVVFASAALIESLDSYWTNSTEQRENFMARGAREGVQYVKSYYFIAWAPKQGVSVHRCVAGYDPKAVFDLPIESFIAQGLHGLIRANPVVQIAPAGHVFKHPSGTINKVFIQARELATSEAELSFVGRAICLAVKPELLTEDLAVVYIDTMGIYSFVREALEFAGSSASIHSFHSYDELSELSPPGEPYLLVISASTSGGMARKLQDEQGFEGERLMTLVDVSNEERRGSVLIALDQVDEAYKRRLIDGTETEIELVGEHFSSKAKPPRAVTLGQPHTPRHLTSVLEHFGIGGMSPINDTPDGTVNPRVVCLNGANAGTNEKLLAWLDAEMRWSVPVAVDHIVSTNDPGSRQMAQSAASILQDARGSSTAPTVIAYEDLKPDSLSTAKGVLVVTAIAGDGGLLREISRDLREFVKASLPRHFLIGVGLPQTEDAWIRLGQFLERNTTHRRYGFSSWLVLPIGADGTSSAWKDLVELAARAQVELPNSNSVNPVQLSKALNLLANVIDAANSGFLPRSDGSPLGLSDGFLFFGSVFKDRLPDVPISATYLAVASVLQAARDLKTPASQLKPTGYESVVLAPENFLRFNDNLLQACILRAAHPSELDYSASPHLSTLMKEFLLKVFTRHEHPYGAASLEFAAALATGRLKLKKSDTQELIEVTVKQLATTSNALLGLLLMVP